MVQNADTFAGFLRDWPQHIRSIAIIGAVSIFIVALIQHVTSPLRKYPGPKLAAFTDLYRLYLVLTNEYEVHISKLHKRYGPIVRLGPNILDFDYPELVKELYGTDSKWVKSDFYASNSNKINGEIRYNMFSTAHADDNKVMKRPIGKHYAPGAVLKLEPLIDDAIRQLCGEVERRFINGANEGKTCDLGAWIAYLTWDIVGTTTFSSPFGYMEKGYDFDDTIKIADKAQDYFSAVGQMPFLDGFLDKNPIKRIGPPNLGNALRIAFERIALRSQGKDTNFDPAVPDYLHYFLEARENNPELVDDGVMVAYIFVNLIAGADTTATTIRATMYFLLMNPGVYKKLKAEILTADVDDIAQYASVKSLPYLDAVIKESMRLHPGVSMPLERWVPPGGLNLPNGTVVPAGTKVGINPYIIHRNKSIYGDDAETFRPERWLRSDGETEEAFEERIRSYNRNDLTFGAGSRICLGRHLSILESYKIVATLINRYDLEIVNGGRDYKTINRWFFRQEGLLCKVAKRS